MRRRRAIALSVAAVLALVGGLAAEPTNPIGYLTRQGYYQLDLLYGREPVADVLASGKLTPEQAENLRRIGEIKAFGKELGLASTENYETINPTWSLVVWNLSASRELEFQSVRWWFPIVGSMPYLGFFRESDARDRVSDLRDRGYDVYLRTAGAYSTLGWFRDPVLPRMLEWDEADLADTILHELTHATLWVPGSAQFNESFANVVGETAALRWLAHAHGEDSPEVAEARAAEADGRKFRAVLLGVYEDLDALYRDETVSDDVKRVRKAALYASIPTRIGAAGLSDPRRYVAAVRRGTWNNARMVQFRTYNRGQDWFEVILAQEGGDIGRFIERIRTITAGTDDPWLAVGTAAGVPAAEIETTLDR